MNLNFTEDAARNCVQLCSTFKDEVKLKRRFVANNQVAASPDGFVTAKQIGDVYSTFMSEDLGTLLGGYVDQAEAMAMLFAAAGGLIDAQDAQAAAAIGKAATPPPAMKSVVLGGSLEAELAEARAVVAAFAAAPGAGAIGLAGEMLDRPHLRRAERLLDRRERAAGRP